MFEYLFSVTAESRPPKDVMENQLLESVNVILFGKRVFADVIKDLEMMSYLMMT